MVPLELERAGGYKKHLRSFKFVGDSGVYHFPWMAKQPVPDWRAWSKAHGMDWGAKAKSVARDGPAKAPTRKVART